MHVSKIVEECTCRDTRLSGDRPVMECTHRDDKSFLTLVLLQGG